MLNEQFKQRLDQALDQRNYEEALQLIRKVLCMNYMNDDDLTLLGEIIEPENVEIVQYLLTRGDINLQNDITKTLNYLIRLGAYLTTPQGNCTKI